MSLFIAGAGWAIYIDVLINVEPFWSRQLTPPERIFTNDYSRYARPIPLTYLVHTFKPHPRSSTLYFLFSRTHSRSTHYVTHSIHTLIHKEWIVTRWSFGAPKKVNAFPTHNARCITTWSIPTIYRILPLVSEDAPSECAHWYDYTYKCMQGDCKVTCIYFCIIYVPTVWSTYRDNDAFIALVDQCITLSRSHALTDKLSACSSGLARLTINRVVSDQCTHRFVSDQADLILDADTMLRCYLPNDMHTHWPANSVLSALAHGLCAVHYACIRRIYRDVSLLVYSLTAG
jgi:hypothetical protein